MKKPVTYGFQKGHKVNLGRKQSPETIAKRIRRGSEHHSWKGGKVFSICMDCGEKTKSRYAVRCRECLDKYCIGANSPNWKGGISKSGTYRAKYNRELRHRLGISKRYIFKYGGKRKYRSHREAMRVWRKNNPIKAKQQKWLYRYNKKRAGLLTLEVVQKVYEDNIKRYKTLTCYLCLKPIPFGKDHLEHKIPLSRSGTNKYNNLGIACQKCNNKKFTKTEEEFRKFMANQSDRR